MDRTKDPRLLGAVAVLALALFGFTPGNCAGEDPEDRDEQGDQGRSCAGLGEDACLADADCTAVYRTEGGDCACPDGRLCDCDFEVEEVFDHCEDRRSSCAEVTCEMYCENGFARDANGCEICQCAPASCESLDEAACEATPGCHPVYQDDGVGCACPECDPDDPSCPPCDCPPEERQYAGCETDHREGWCRSDADCSGDEVCVFDDGTTGDGCSCPDGADCDCAERVGKCAPGQPPGCDLDCPEGHECQVICGPVDCVGEGPDCGGEACEQQCVPVDGSCDADEDCPGGSCVEGRCGPEQCDSDEDCPGGSCEPYYTCMAVGCPPAGSTCVYETSACGDGSELYCDALPPECDEGEVAAVVDHCWSCVDDSCADGCDDARYDAAGQCVGPDGTVKNAECCADGR